MDAVEEETMAGLSNNSTSNNTNNDQQSSHALVKGKRTKRQRLHLPLASATAASVGAASTSSSSSAESPSSTTEEDEDMANCLILLAQGRRSRESGMAEEPAPATGGGTADKFTSRRFAEAATTTDGKARFYVYECKTCNKCFPSFQALGGHRASHKKPKIAAPAIATEEKKVADADEDSLQIRMNTFSKTILSINNNTGTSSCNNNKARVHECSICGSEFSSGQALGGHMRRHRPLTAADPPEIKKERNVLSLDLNLPAPSEDDQREFPQSPSGAGAVAFPFESKPSLVFSASALVDCHY